MYKTEIVGDNATLNTYFKRMVHNRLWERERERLIFLETDINT